MKFGYMITYVSDVEKTVEFYQKAFSLDLLFLHESKQYAEMKTGGTTLAFASESLAQSNGLKVRPNIGSELPAGFEIAFVTDDVSLAFKLAIDAGAEEVYTPQHKPWGQLVCYVRDINGILIEICEPMK